MKTIKDKYTACKQVLDGEREALSSAFSWRETPQGHTHWRARYNGEVPLSEDDRAYIRGLMYEYEHENGTETEAPVTAPMPVFVPTTINPPHYTFGKFEVIEVLEDWFAADPLLWQVGKYISRAGRKGEMLEDLKKAQWYLERKIASVEAYKGPSPAKEKEDSFCVGDKVFHAYRTQSAGTVVGAEDADGWLLVRYMDGVQRRVPKENIQHYGGEKTSPPAEDEDVTASETGFAPGDKVGHAFYSNLGVGTVEEYPDKEGWIRARFPCRSPSSGIWRAANLRHAEPRHAEEQISPAEEVDRIRGKK